MGNRCALVAKNEKGTRSQKKHGKYVHSWGSSFQITEENKYSQDLDSITPEVSG
jgi:hypothetical protein